MSYLKNKQISRYTCVLNAYFWDLRECANDRSLCMHLRQKVYYETNNVAASKKRSFANLTIIIAIYIFRLSQSQSGPFLIHDLLPGFNKSNAMRDASGEGTTNPSIVPEFTSDFQWNSRCAIFYFCVVFYIPLFAIFRLTIALFVLRCRASDYHFSVFILFLHA